jgi:hypothetical protein
MSLGEYVDLKLPTAGLASLLLNNRVTSSFLEVVPGLPDLVSLGKLWHGVTRGSASFHPDLVILVGPASGHAVARLKAPANFQRITKAGPIHKDAALMTEFFSGPENLGIALTTLPEEMSLQETAELQRTFHRDFPPPTVFVNRCFPLLPEVEEKESQPHKAYAYCRERGRREQKAVAAYQGKWAKIPFFFPDPQKPPLYLRISAALL